MLPLVLFNSMDPALKTGSVHELLALNQHLQQQGLVLTPADAEEIMIARKETLKGQGRIELDIEVPKMLIRRISESPYISRDDFVKTVKEIYEVFHYIKNATSDFTGDEEIITAIITYYEDVCGGSTEYLMGKGVEKIVDNFRQKRDLAETKTEQEVDEQYWNFDQ